MCEGVCLRAEDACCPGMDGEAGRHHPWKGIPEKIKNIPAFPAETLPYLTSHKVQHIPKPNARFGQYLVACAGHVRSPIHRHV